MTPARQTFKLDVVGDYRRHPRPQGRRRGAHRHARLLTREDHGRRDLGRQGRLRREAGLEHIPRINAMLDAYKKSERVVQVGTQQRSWDHFIEAKKFLDSGVLGTITARRHRAARLLRAAEGGRAAGAGRSRLGHVADGRGAEAAVQAVAGSGSARGTTTAAA